MFIDIYCIIFIICITRVISHNHWLNEKYLEHFPMKTRGEI